MKSYIKGLLCVAGEGGYLWRYISVTRTDKGFASYKSFMIFNFFKRAQEQKIVHSIFNNNNLKGHYLPKS
jgi:hypothetical protein